MSGGAREAPRVVATASLVRRLLRSQFPQWAHLPVEPASLNGWDNTTFRLGEELSVRLPTAERYTPQVDKEHEWLPRLAPLLPLPIPIPLAKGAPAEGYPWPWSVYRWLDGEPAAMAPITDRRAFAADLGRFLAAMHRADAAGGPEPGEHNFFRGGSLSVYDAETRAALAALSDEVDARAAATVWREALASTWGRPPVWVHGDVAPGNLLVRDGRLRAVIDFGCAAVGDPACDLAIAWTFIDGDARTAFRAALPLDDGTWARGRGWALWKALITLADDGNAAGAKAAEALRVVTAVVADADP
jgi:aminoglycoside phosphotransferase (APT) family kinase protein